MKHVRTSVLTQNEDAFRGLDYGADDFDLPIEDEVTQKAGATIDLDLERCWKSPAGSAIRSSTGGRAPAGARPAGTDPAGAQSLGGHRRRLQG